MVGKRVRYGKIDPLKTYRKTDRVLFRVTGQGHKGESASALRQFKLDYTKDEGSCVRSFKDGEKMVYDVTNANMFNSTQYGHSYRKVLEDYNRLQKEETGYIYE